MNSFKSWMDLSIYCCSILFASKKEKKWQQLCDSYACVVFKFPLCLREYKTGDNTSIIKRSREIVRRICERGEGFWVGREKNLFSSYWGPKSFLCAGSFGFLIFSPIWLRLHAEFGCLLPVLLIVRREERSMAQLSTFFFQCLS